MTDNAKYWLWLTLSLGYKTAKYKRLRALYPNVEDFYSGGEKEWRLSGILSESNLEKLRSVSLSDAQEAADRCLSSGIDLLTLDDPRYPERLRMIDDPPAVLFVKGELPDFSKQLAIAMVGTRQATEYGKMIAHRLALSLAKCGVVVVSGGALGVDSLSHTAALQAGGKTVCVLGCGVDYPYLLQNKKLRAEIAASGALVSEYPPDFPAAKYTFPDRNRIISALSDGVVVVEAGEKSGSLITARCALQQGKDVFAVMGNITSPYSQGTNRLIKDGAIPVTDYTDITARYPAYGIAAEKESLVVAGPVRRTDVSLSPDALKVYEAITAEPTHVDAITAKCALPVSTVLRTITELELDDLIAAEKGRMYRLK